MEENNIKQIVKDEIRKYMKSGAFTDRKLTDTPTDALSVVNRKYVTSNGTSFPASPVTGQYFFSSVLSKPSWYNGKNWVDPTASIIG
uniref:Putative structural protein n=1 Tax=viral metagenome TaxID=1070528 RepID=A0A6M3J8U0_9ZZZZ